MFLFVFLVVGCGAGKVLRDSEGSRVAMQQQHQQRQWRWADDEDDNGDDDDYTEERALAHQRQQWDLDAAEGEGVDGDALANGYQMLEELGSMSFSCLSVETRPHHADWLHLCRRLLWRRL